MLPVIADGQALRAKVIEAQKILLKLDQETQSARSSLPAAIGVFDPVHTALAAKPPMQGQYGGGMSPRLEFIEKSLAKSLKDLAKLPAATSQQLLLKNVALVSQAQAQIRRVAKEGNNLIEVVKGRLRQENDVVSSMGLDGYNKKLQSGLEAAAKALGTGLTGKNLNVKRMPKFGTAGLPAVKLPNVKEAGEQIISASGGLAAPKPAASVALASSKASEASLAKSNATPQAAGGNGSDSSGKTDTARASKSAADVPAVALSCDQPHNNWKACRCGHNVDCYIAVESAPCNSINYAWNLESDTHVLADRQAALAREQARCNSGEASPEYCSVSLGLDKCGINCYQQAIRIDRKFMERCEKPQIKCDPGYVVSGTKCVKACPDGKTAPNPQGQCPCGKKLFDPYSACCANNTTLFSGQFPVAGGKCSKIPAEVTAAEALLTKTKTGSEIAKYLNDNHVPFQYAVLPSGTLAEYENGKILLPRNASDMPAAQLAAVLGHEGYHAMHRNVVRSFEDEEDATLKEVAIYDELIKGVKSVKELPDTNAEEKKYLTFKTILQYKGAGPDGLDYFDRAVDDAYKDDDPPYAHLAALEKKSAGSAKKAVQQSKTLHTDTQNWALKWITQHKDEF